MFNQIYIGYPLLSLLLLFGACKPQQSPKSSKKEKALPVVSAKPKEVPNVNFDLTGFLNAYNYKVQYESFGFLNGDSLKDKVLVLQEYNEGGIYNPRLTMVLLGNKNGFWLYSQSQTILPAEYSTVNNNIIFDTEEVNIDAGKLVFDLYAIGPNGHVYFDYSWNNDKLVLHELTGRFMGAGAHSAVTYLAKTETEGMVTETTVNTMEEEMPAESTKRTVQLKCKTTFENFEYDRCLQEIMR
jgi:hypothetical protein